MIRWTLILHALVLSILSVNAQAGETIFLVEPSAENRFPPSPPAKVEKQSAPGLTAPDQAPRPLTIQRQLPAGWHVQVPLLEADLDKAAEAAQRLRPLLGETGLYLIELGGAYRLSAGPILPSRLQSTLQRLRQAGWASAVLRHFPSNP